MLSNMTTLKLSDNARKLYDALLSNVESVEDRKGGRWGCVYLDNVSRGDLTPRQWSGYLGALTRAGVYENVADPRDGDEKTGYFGYVLMKTQTEVSSGNAKNDPSEHVTTTTEVSKTMSANTKTPNPAKRNTSLTVNIVRVKEAVRREHENKGFVIDTYQCGAEDCQHKFTAYRRSVIGAGRRCQKCNARNVVPGSPAAEMVVQGRKSKPRAEKKEKAAKPAKKAAPKKAPAKKAASKKAAKDPKAEAARLRDMKKSQDAKSSRAPRARKAAAPAEAPEDTSSPFA